jgi:ABC-type polysaccharide/polyol phosphate export permease
MFVTNVLYPLPAGTAALRVLVTVNPMVPIISAGRTIILDGQVPPAGPLLVSAAVAAAVTASGWMVFQALEPGFAERV